MAWMAHAGGCIGLRGSSDSPVKEGREVLGVGSLRDRPFWVGASTVPRLGPCWLVPEPGAGFQAKRWRSSFPLKHRRLRAHSGQRREGAMSLTLQINSLPALGVASDLQGSGI